MTWPNEGMKAMKQVKQWILFLGLALQLVAVSAAWAAAGRFQFVVGDVRVVDAVGKERPARKGGEVNEGDSIVSAASGSAQLVMVDKGILAVRPDTRMKIDEYKYSGKEDGTERSFFSIVKGGFRSITGAIGKTHKENYRIKTPAATIGIRGTDSETVHIVIPMPAVPEGTYNKVNQGATVMNGTAIAPNQVGYTPNLQTSAVILPAMPPIFEAPKAGQGQKKDEKDNGANGGKNGDKKDAQKSGESGKKNGESAQDGQQQGDTAQNGQSGSSSEGTGATTSTASPTTATSATTSTSTVVSSASTTTVPPSTPIVTASTVTDGGVAPGTSFVAAPIGVGGVGSEITVRTECHPTCYTGPWAGGGTMVREEGKVQTLLIDPATGMPVLMAEQDGTDNFQYSVGTSSLQGYGQATVGGVEVHWGRYVGADKMVDKDGITRDPIVMNLAVAKSVLNYLEASSYISSASLPVVFSTHVGGSITDELGNVYGLTGGVVDNMLVINSLGDVRLNIHAVTSGRDWMLYYGSGAEGLQNFYGSGCAANTPCGLGLQLGSSTYNGSSIGALNPGAKGEAHGVLIGSGGSAAGALSSFAATVPGAAAISGVVVFKP